MTMRPVLWILAGLLAFCSFVEAAFDDDFTHARAMGMGEAYVADARDGDCILINPAGLWQSPGQLALTHASLYPGLEDGSVIQQQLASYVHQPSPQNTIGVAWKRLSVRHLYSEDTYAFAYARYAELYKQSGETRTLRMAYAIGGAVRLIRWDAAPTVGPDGRVLEDLAGPFRVALDGGLLVYPSRTTAVALAVRNLNRPDIASPKAAVRERLPIQTRLGLALKATHVTWTFDLHFHAHQTDLRTGVEWELFPERLMVRGGVQLQNLAWGTTVMLGLGYMPTSRLRLDYAFMQVIQGIHAPWGSHRLSLVYAI